MQPRLRLLVTALLLAVAVLLGWQPRPVLACAMGDAGCRDHCAIVASSCAVSCPAPIAPMPLAAPLPEREPQAIAFSFNWPILRGLTIAPATTPPRIAA